MKFQVRAVVMDLQTRDFRRERTEYIDTEENPLYHGVNTPGIRNTRTAERMVETIYETYDNHPVSDEVVKVIGVKRQE